MTTNDTTSPTLAERLAALNAARAHKDALVARARAKADALHAKAEATWQAYVAAITTAPNVRDFDAARALRTQYNDERKAANIARGHLSAAEKRPVRRA
jgi:hypothetical protein